MEELIPRRDFSRAFQVEDITIRSDGGGRTVQAYITPFHADAERGGEIKDQDGHYYEKTGRGAFTKTLSERGLNFAVLFNHGRTFDGKPDGALMVPVGVPKLIEPHERGLYSETEYLENPLADAALDAVKKGAIRGYSYTGTFMKSIRQRAASRGELPTIHRNEIAMREYGPVLFPAHIGADVIGTRMTQFLDELDPEDIDRFRQMLGIATPLEPAEAVGTAPAAAQTEDPPAGQSARTPEQLRAQIRARNTARGIRK